MKEALAEGRQNATLRNRANINQLIEEGRARRKAELDRMLSTLRGQRDELVEERIRVAREMNEISTNHPDYQKKR